jgi:hypothetical protein
LHEQPLETTLYSLADAPPEPPERRTSERYLSLLRVGVLKIDERRELCLIKNISAGGMLIRAYSAIEPDTRLSIELKQGEPVAGFARWAENGLIGVTFDSAIDVLALLCPPNDGPRPRMPRIEVNCTAWIREGAKVRRVRALNISQGGACVDTASELTVGAEVIVTLLGFAPIPSVVNWKDGSSYGISFNHVLALSDLVAWLGEQQERQRAAG